MPEAEETTTLKHDSENTSKLKDDLDKIPLDLVEDEKDKIAQNSTPDGENMSKRAILKNLAVMSLVFLLLFTAFQTLATLQSTLNNANNLGVVSQSTIYASIVVSSMFLPKATVAYLGCKWTIFFSTITYLLYIAANFYPRLWTLVPAGVILGIGAAPLWSAKCAYLTDIGGKYARLSGETEEAVITRFFGIFFGAFQCSFVIGQLVSSLVLQSSNELHTNMSDIVGYCGAKFCPDTFDNLNYSNPNLERPSDTKVFTVIGVFSGCAILATITVAVGLTNLRQTTGIRGKPFDLSLLVATFRQLRKPLQIVVIPITLFSGLEQGFLMGDFTQSFVGCSLGIWNIGFVLICYGVVDACTSLATGHLVKYTGRVVLFMAGFAVSLASILTMLLWRPGPHVTYAFYLLAAAWGFSDAIWQTQVNALYGCLFGKESEAAFSNYKIFEALGSIIAYSYSGLVCTSIKLYVLLAVLIVGIVGYGIAEYLVKKKLKRNMYEH